MMGDAPHHDAHHALAPLLLYDASPPRAGAFFTHAYARLLLHSAMRRRYRDCTVHVDERLQEARSRDSERFRKPVDVLIFVRLAVVVGRARPLTRQALQETNRSIFGILRPAQYDLLRANGRSPRGTCDRD